MKRTLDGRRIAHDVSTPAIKRSSDVQVDSSVTFADLQLHPSVLAGLTKAGFVHPSPIQLQSIPLGRCGVDLVLQSKSGTGKTCVFAVIVLEALMTNPQCQSTQALVVAPTREVATQVSEVITLLAKPIEHIKCGLFIGGTQFKIDRSKLSAVAGCQIVIGTPGRLRQLIDLNVLRSDTISVLVLDEADKLMDDQFKEQINDIYRRLPADKQMIATSATYPDELATFISQYMQAPQFVRLCTDNLSLLSVEQLYVWCECGHSSKVTEDNKLKLLIDILAKISYHQCIVFTNYQARAPKVCQYLNAHLGHHSNQQNQDTDSDSIPQDQSKHVTYLCAELCQSERIKTFQQFKRSMNPILVSTDVAARGIDIRDIDLVVNFDIPSDFSTYYHRIGRAGRFGSPGRAITIVAKNWPSDSRLIKQFCASCPQMKRLEISDVSSLGERAM